MESMVISVEGLSILRDSDNLQILLSGPWHAEDSTPPITGGCFADAASFDTESAPPQ